jgi:tRNA(fMet)-specific endonuclease VapC
LDDQWILADTSIFIDYFRKKNKQKALLYHLSNQFVISSSAVCFFEVYAGAKEQDLDFVRTMFNNIHIFPFDTEIAKKASELYQQLRKKNQLIEFRDLFISSTALVHNLSLATLDKKHFGRIPQLRLYHAKSNLM